MHNHKTLDIPTNKNTVRTNTLIKSQEAASRIPVKKALECTGLLESNIASLGELHSQLVHASQRLVGVPQGIHFGLAEQLTARRDPHRLTYLSLDSRVRRDFSWDVGRDAMRRGQACEGQAAVGKMMVPKIHSKCKKHGEHIWDDLAPSRAVYP